MKPQAVEILLVEDNRNDAELTLRALDKHNLANKVHVLRDGEEALDFVFRTGQYADRDIHDAPKLILLDLKLLKVGGLDVLRRVKGDDRTKSIPMVVLTSSREERDLVESYALGANSYIVKPIDFDRFMEVVAEVGLYWLLVNEAPPQPNGGR